MCHFNHQLQFLNCSEMLPKIIIFSTFLITSTKSTWTKIKDFDEDTETDLLHWSETDKYVIEKIVEVFIPVMIPNLIKSMEDEKIRKIIQSIRPETLSKAITDEQKSQLFLHINNSEWMTQAIQSLNEQQKKRIIEELSKNHHICNLANSVKISHLLSLLCVAFSCIS